MEKNDIKIEYTQGMSREDFYKKNECIISESKNLSFNHSNERDLEKIEYRIDLFMFIYWMLFIFISCIPVSILLSYALISDKMSLDKIEEIRISIYTSITIVTSVGLHTLYNKVPFLKMIIPSIHKNLFLKQSLLIDRKKRKELLEYEIGIKTMQPFVGDFYKINQQKKWKKDIVKVVEVDSESNNALLDDGTVISFPDLRINYSLMTEEDLNKIEFKTLE